MHLPSSQGPLVAAAGIVLTLAACSPEVADSPDLCIDPMPESPTWWRWVQVADDEFRAPRSPGFTDDPTTQLAGPHRLLMIYTAPESRADTFETHLSLEALTERTLAVVLEGSTQPRTSWPTDLSIVAASSDESAETIAMWEPGEEITLMVGVSGPDTGLMLSVFRIGPESVLGRWVDGGISSDTAQSDLPQGYFCMTPIESD